MHSPSQAYQKGNEVFSGVSQVQLLDLFGEVEELLQRIAHTEDRFLRHNRARVHSKLVAIKGFVIS